MRILLINQYFPPDGGASAHLLGQLAEDLAGTHSVEVLAGRPSYPAPRSELRPHGVRVRRVPSTSFGHRSIAGRAANYLTFAGLASIQACRGKRPDVIVTLTNPPFLGLAGVIAAARHRAKLVVVCHDVFPDLAVALGHLHSPLLVRAWHRVNRLVRARAARIVVVGRDMEQRLRSQGVEADKLTFIPAWAERQPVDPALTQRLRSEHGWEGRFVVMHAGNVGLAQNVTILADLAERVRQTPEILVVVLGDGPARAEFERTVSERGLTNVERLDALPRSSAQALMAAADLHVVSLVPGLWGCSAPSKTYGIMAAGRPFVAAVDSGSEPDLLANELGCGWRVPAADADALAATVLAARGDRLDEMGERGRRGFEERFARELITAQHAEVLELAARGGSGRSPGTRPSPGEVAPAARTDAAIRLALDAATADAVQALRAQSIRAILMKGPAISRWLYAPPSDRRYRDIDLLVWPGQFDAAAEVLGGLGYHAVLPGAGWGSERSKWSITSSTSRAMAVSGRWRSTCTGGCCQGGHRAVRCLAVAQRGHQTIGGGWR